MRNLRTINLNSILFLDIETVPQWKTLSEAPERVRKEWIYKHKFGNDAPSAPNPEKNANDAQKFVQEKYAQYFIDLWDKKAGLFAEFSKIVCISMGYVDGKEARIKSYYQESEAELLTAFQEDFNQFCDSVKYARPCAHYGFGFDYPFISKRMLIHGLKIPLALDTWGLKPWETSTLDTQEMWKMGNWGAASATLSSIAMAFGIPSPKDDIEGADVARLYYQGISEGKSGYEDAIGSIVNYCEKDVFTLIQILKKMRGEELLPQPEETLF